MTSLSRRLSLGTGSMLAALLVLFWLVSAYGAHLLVKRYLEHGLEQDAEALLVAVQSDPDTSLTLSSTPSPEYQRPFSGHYFQVEAMGEVLRSRSLWDTELNFATAIPVLGESRIEHLAGPQEQPLAVFRRTYVRAGTPVTVSVAEDLTELQQFERLFQLALTLVALLAFAAVLLIQRQVVRRGLGPLEQLRLQIRALERGEIGKLSRDVPTEVQPLVREINSLLELTTRRLERSRNAVGNLSHALKGPLGLLVHLADSNNTGLDPAHRTLVHEQTQRIRERVETELKRARLAGSASPGQRFRPAEELPHLVRAIQAMYRDKPLRIDWHAPEQLSIPADRDDMLELLGNLLDNAAKWARSQVHITVTDAPQPTLRVEDDGPGCPPEEHARLEERGQRADEQQPGHGLGLSIVRAIVEDYGATLTLGHSETLGGFCAQVQWPREPA